MKAIPNPGTYAAALAGSMVVYKTEDGALCVAVPVKLLSGEVQWQGKHTVTLATKEGQLQAKSIDTMKKVFGWDGQDFFWLEDQDFSAVEFEVVGEHSGYIPAGEAEEVLVFKIKWLNPKGGSTKMPEKVVDRKALLAEYGSKFKAMSGGTAKAPAKTATPAAKTTTAPAKAAAAPPPGRKSTGAVARTSTQEEVWQAIYDANDEDGCTEKYWAAVEKIKPGASTDGTIGDFTPAMWGKVAIELGV